MNVPSRFQLIRDTFSTRWSEKPPELLKKEADEFRVGLEHRKPWWRPWGKPITEQDIQNLRKACIEQHRGDFLAIVFQKFAAPPEGELKDLFRRAAGPSMISSHSHAVMGTGQVLFLDFQALREMLAAGSRSQSFMEHAHAVLSETKKTLRQPFDGRSNRRELITAIDGLEVMKAPVMAGAPPPGGSAYPAPGSGDWSRAGTVC